MPGSYEEFRARVFGMGQQERDLPLIMQLLEASGAEGPEQFAAIVGSTYGLDSEETERLTKDLRAETGIVFPTMVDSSGDNDEDE